MRRDSIVYGAALLVGGLLACAGTAWAQTVPKNPAEVARPAGKVPGLPPLALVKVADGFNDPVGVAAANDGTGCLFVVERVGRIKIVSKDGQVLAEPFLDLTKTNPLGSEVQTGFVEQGLWSVAFHPKFKENGHLFVHYSSLPFNGASIVARYTVDRASPDRITSEQANKTVKVLMNIPQPYYNHYGGTIAFGPDGFLYIGKGDGGWEGDPLDAGQRLDTPLAKLLRVDVDVPDDQPYRVPPSNPFAAASKDRMMSLFGVTEEGGRRRPRGRAARRARPVAASSPSGTSSTTPRSTSPSGRRSRRPVASPAGERGAGRRRTGRTRTPATRTRSPRGSGTTTPGARPVTSRTGRAASAPV